MGRSLREEQSPIFRRLACALVEATPEWWSAAELELVAPPSGLGSGLAHSIWSDEHPHDLVIPTDEIMEATRALELASVQRGDDWSRSAFRIMRGPSGQWRFSVTFERDA
jgi:hypothetical protein